MITEAIHRHVGRFCFSQTNNKQAPFPGHSSETSMSGTVNGKIVPKKQSKKSRPVPLQENGYVKVRLVVPCG